MHEYVRLLAMTGPLLEAGWSAAADLTSDATARIEHRVLQSPGRACYLHASYYPETGELCAVLIGRSDLGPSWRASLGELPAPLIHAAALAARTESRENVPDLLARAGWREALGPGPGGRVRGYTSQDSSRAVTSDQAGGWFITRTDPGLRRAPITCDSQVPARVIAALALTDAGQALEPVAPDFETAAELEHLTTMLTGAGWNLTDTAGLLSEELDEPGASGFHLAILTAPDRAASLIAAWGRAGASTQISDAVEQDTGSWRIEASNLPGHVIAAAALAATAPTPPDRPAPGVPDLLEAAGWHRSAPIETTDFSAATWRDPDFTRVVSQTFLLGPDGERTSCLWVIERRDIPADARPVQANATASAPPAAIAALALTGASR
jgi:hypothetical protein